MTMSILIIASLATVAPCIAVWLADAQHRVSARG